MFFQQRDARRALKDAEPISGALLFLHFNKPTQHLLSNYYVLKSDDIPHKVRILDVYV